MQNTVSVIQNHSTNLFKDSTAPTARICNFRQRSNCPLYEKCLSECLVYHQTKLKVVMVLVKKALKSITATIQLLLEIKMKKKVLNSQNISES